MHGNADDVVPIVQGRLMVDALLAAGAAVEFSEFDSTSHGPTPGQARRGVAEALAWFEEHLLR
jgi:dipeptidyl aminopeptidase/acylaminoacyl peptidase